MRRPILLHRPQAVHWIIKINIFVFFMWHVWPNFMIKHFLVSWKVLEGGQFWTLITSVFSHHLLFHLFLNLFAFFGFGAVLENLLGTKRFLKFYFMAGIIASFSHCLVSYSLMNQPQLQALGASGAVSGVIMLFSLMFPQEKILILGFIPMPAISAAVIFVGLDLWGLVAQTQGGSLPIGHGAHLGGALFGILYYLLTVRKKIRSEVYF